MSGTPDTGAERSTVVLATSNGTGMGHLARQAAVGRALGRDHADRVEPVVFSLSTAAHVVDRHGLRAEYCPSHHRGWMPHPLWHGYLRDRVSALLDELGARVVAFDGVAPYLGLLRARAAHPDVAFVWIRRGLWRPGRNTRALAAGRFFDRIIEPGDLAAAADRGPTASASDAVRVPPITAIEGVSPLSRADAAAELGLDPDRPTALITLGAGSLNDPTALARSAIGAFLADPDWQIALTRAPLAVSSLPVEDARRVRELVGVYPLARYLSAFDAAVSAAGYNAVHELLYAGVPTVFVPNAATATDDQVARARWAAEGGYAAYAAEDSPDAVGAEAGRLLSASRRAELVDACSSLAPPIGAAAAAESLAGLAGGFGGHVPAVGERARAVDLALREAAMRGLGTAGTALVRRALGRTASGGPLSRLAVEPLLTDRLDPDVLRGDQPVEHLMAGTSPAYRDRRTRLARRVYRWPSPPPRPAAVGGAGAERGAGPGAGTGPDADASTDESISAAKAASTGGGAGPGAGASADTGTGVGAGGGTGTAGGAGSHASSE